MEPALVGRPLGFVIGLQITQGTQLDGILDELVGLAEIDEGPAPVLGAGPSRRALALPDI